MDVFVESGKLRARLDPAQFDFDAVFDLVSVSKDRFNPFFYRAGKPFDTEDFAIVFVNPGNETRVEWRGIHERVIAQGGRRR
jgi:hypothetical protein